MYMQHKTQHSMAWRENGRFLPLQRSETRRPVLPVHLLLCIERLNHIIEEAMANGSWKPIFVRKNDPLLSSLLFADDRILFGEASVAQAFVIKAILIDSARPRDKN